MKEIKFRAWDKIDKIMFDPYKVTLDCIERNNSLISPNEGKMKNLV